MQYDWPATTTTVAYLHTKKNIVNLSIYYVCCADIVFFFSSFSIFLFDERKVKWQIVVTLERILPQHVLGEKAPMLLVYIKEMYPFIHFSCRVLPVPAVLFANATVATVWPWSLGKTLFQIPNFVRKE